MGHKLEADTESVIETESEPAREATEGGGDIQDQDKGKGREREKGQDSEEREGKSEGREEETGEFVGEPVEKEHKVEEVAEEAPQGAKVPKETVKAVVSQEPALICKARGRRG